MTNMHIKKEIFAKFPINCVVQWWDEVEKDRLNFGVVVGYSKSSTDGIALKTEMIVEFDTNIDKKTIIFLNPYNKDTMVTHVITGDYVYAL